MAQSNEWGETWTTTHAPDAVDYKFVVVKHEMMDDGNETKTLSTAGKSFFTTEQFYTFYMPLIVFLLLIIIAFICVAVLYCYMYCSTSNGAYVVPQPRVTFDLEDFRHEGRIK